MAHVCLHSQKRCHFSAPALGETSDADMLTGFSQRSPLDSVPRQCSWHWSVKCLDLLLLLYLIVRFSKLRYRARTMSVKHQIYESFLVMSFSASYLYYKSYSRR